MNMSQFEWIKIIVQVTKFCFTEDNSFLLGYGQFSYIQWYCIIRVQVS